MAPAALAFWMGACAEPPAPEHVWARDADGYLVFSLAGDERPVRLLGDGKSPEPADDHHTSWDGRLAVYDREGRTVHSDERHTPRWSPDGEVLAYFTDSGSLRAYMAGTGAVRTIADNPGLDARMIVWTGDGKRLLTFRTHRSRYDDSRVRIELIEVDVASGAQRPLLDVPDYTEPLPSPDGRHFALDSNGSILVHDENGALVERLSESRIAATGNDERLSIGPWTWTPDGSRLVFCSTVLALNTKTSADIRSALHVWDLRSNRLRRLADDCDFDHIEVRSTAR